MVWIVANRALGPNRVTFHRAWAGVIVMAIAATAIASDYTVRSFAAGGRRIPQGPDDVIAPVAGTGLTPVAEAPAGTRPGRLFLRRRFSAHEYRLYRGRVHPGAFAVVSAFRAPEGIGLQQLMHLKVYEKRNAANPAQDISTVYFGTGPGKRPLIFLNRQVIYVYIDGTWYPLKAQPPHGTVAASSEPPARIEIDGRTWAETPLDVQQPAGFHKVRFIREGYHDHMVETLVYPGATSHVSATLRPIVHRVTLSSKPPGAVVSVNNEPRGAAPLHVDLRFGTHTVVFDLEGYRVDTTQVTVGTTAVGNVVHELAEVGYIDAQLEPPNATLAIDGSELDRRGSYFEATPGTHAVEASAPYRESATERLTVRHNQVTSVSFDLPVAVEYRADLAIKPLFFAGVGRMSENGLFSFGGLEFAAETAVLAGGIYSTVRSRIHYDRYRKATVHPLMQKEYDQASRYAGYAKLLLAGAGVIHLAGVVDGIIHSVVHTRRLREKANAGVAAGPGYVQCVIVF